MGNRERTPGPAEPAATMLPAERKRPSASGGEQAIIVYDLRPVPHWQKYWIKH